MKNDVDTNLGRATMYARLSRLWEKKKKKKKKKDWVMGERGGSWGGDICMHIADLVLLYSRNLIECCKPIILQLKISIKKKD